MNWSNPSDPADIKLLKQLESYSNFKSKLSVCKTRPDQNIFRQQLINYFLKCPITGLGPDECEAAHIIPVSSKGEYVLTNGLLLGAHIHKTFDKYLWSIDPLTYQIVCKPGSGSIETCNPNSLVGIIGSEWFNSIKSHWDCFVSNDSKKI